MWYSNYNREAPWTSWLLLLIINVVDVLAQTAINFDVNNSWFLYNATIIRDALFIDFCHWWLIIIKISNFFFSIYLIKYFLKKKIIFQYYILLLWYFCRYLFQLVHMLLYDTSIWTCWFWISSMQNLMINVLQKDKSQIKKKICETILNLCT